MGLIRFGGITRGEGEVFQLVHVDAPDGCYVRACAKSSNGDAPCAVTSHGLPNGTYVLILATLSCSQRVEVSVYDSAGVCIASASETVSHFRASLSSKANTFLRNNKVNSVRNIDRNPLPDVASISSTFAVLDEEKGVRTTYFIIQAPSETNAMPGFRFGLVAENGEEVPVGNLTVLHDSLSAGHDGASPRIRHIELSCDIPDVVSDYTAWVRFDDAALPAGLACFSSSKLAALKQETDAAMFGRSGQGAGYQDWFLNRHRAKNEELELQKGASFEIEPMFSVVMPQCGAAAKHFDKTVASVLGQTYGRFELLLVLPAGDSDQLHQSAQTMAELDTRIKLLEPVEGRGYAAQANAGIRAAKGDFVCLLGQGDVLEPDILFEYVRGVNSYPETDLLYCDEDKLAGDCYVDGLLKPDFDGTLLLSCNYVRDMLTVSASCVAALGVLPEEESAGAYRWALTLAAAGVARNVYHARKVLYHWRPGSTPDSGYFAVGEAERVACRDVVQGYLDGLGVDAEVICRSDQEARYDVTYELPDQPPLVSIIIPSKDHIDYLERCLESIYRETTYPNFEVVVVENNSELESTFTFYDEAKRRYANLSVVAYEQPFNFSAVCNLGASAAKGDILLFLNNDTEALSPCWLERMVGHLMRENVGCVGAKLLYPSGGIQHIGVAILKVGPGHTDLLCPSSTNAYFGLLRFPRSVSAVTGACLAVRREVFRSVDGFDEGFPLAFNDVDFCLKVREGGYVNVVEPRAVLYHYESVSRGYDEQTLEKLARLDSERNTFESRYPSFFSAGDPYYSCNFNRTACHRELG